MHDQGTIEWGRMKATSPDEGKSLYYTPGTLFENPRALSATEMPPRSSSCDKNKRQRPQLHVLSWGYGYQSISNEQCLVADPFQHRSSLAI